MLPRVLLDTKFRRLPVVDETGRLVSLVCRAWKRSIVIRRWISQVGTIWLCFYAYSLSIFHCGLPTRLPLLVRDTQLRIDAVNYFLSMNALDLQFDICCEAYFPWCGTTGWSSDQRQCRESCTYNEASCREGCEWRHIEPVIRLAVFVTSIDLSVLASYLSDTASYKSQSHNRHYKYTHRHSFARFSEEIWHIISSTLSRS